MRAVILEKKGKVVVREIEAYTALNDDAVRIAVTHVGRGSTRGL